MLLDQMGNAVSVPKSPQRIISLVPSQTELLYDLGIGDRVIGITKFCNHPSAWRDTKTIVGGTKNFHLDTIDSLNPDLIIGNKEENYEEGITKLREKYPVWMSDIVTIGDAVNMIRTISGLVGSTAKGVELIGLIHKAFKDLKSVRPAKTLYLIWRKPWMGAAGKTFINSMFTQVGLKNVLDTCERYPELTEDQIKTLDPSIVLLSSEPYPFAKKHIEEIKQIVPNARILLVDGEMFSWYGSRMAKAPAYINSIQFED